MYIKRLLLLALLVSCSIEEPIDECECIKSVTRSKTVIVMIDGLPHTRSETTLMYEEVVPCQDENKGSMGDGLFFEIECN